MLETKCYKNKEYNDTLMTFCRTTQTGFKQITVPWSIQGNKM